MQYMKLMAITILTTILFIVSILEILVYDESNRKIRKPYFRANSRAYLQVCKTFDFDPVEWTLYKKSSNLNENKTCVELYNSIFKG